ncbi:MAG TPA: G5 domain-containing protein [Candidatus Dojkabacteria bacterium]|nr:G5 domain-containing protein [Candidatus Dojkabacteria bacterium]
MDRSIRVNGSARLKTYLFTFTLLVLTVAVLIVTGLEFGASYAYAGETRNDKSSALSIDTSTLPKKNRSIFAPKVVAVTSKAGTFKALVYGRTVGEVLSEMKISLDEDDLTIPDIEEVITEKRVIQVIKVDVEYKNREEIIPFTLVEKKTEELNTGTVKIDQEGSNGLLVKTIKVIYRDGVAFKSSVVKSEVTKKAIDKIVLIGTKPVTIQSCGYWDAVIDRYVDPTLFKQKNDWMKFIMRCETWCDSGQNTRNVYLGLYQFNKKTYTAYGGTNIWDGTEQIEIVSKMYDTPGNRAWHWPACNAKYLSR